ncbi:tRNA (cytosine-5-)-methyltransferase ncl1 [Tilletia horrida]|uniref:orotate phosphoribosyltransferase n=1 Tax=Tilletia horrida TaxID=155126 RepID=A0AAN6JWX2_9BASI|nr:tRNA (cytosine-5-)-methyltransferase ncl1 [Tilletia horrida]KAK0563676.1 tRNA (cytosine-5-)-methyltransferase ncl1 [Tilletia horrida]
MSSSTSTTAAAGAPLEAHQKAYIELAIRTDVLKFGGPFTLKSGRLSPYFFNSGLFSTGEAIAQVASSYAAAIAKSGIEFDVLFGPAYKGITLAATTALALYRDHNISVEFAYNRKEAKTHGEGGSLVGASLAGKRVLIIDDVITAGTAIGEATSILATQSDAKLAGICIALDRQERASTDDNDPDKRSTIHKVEEKYGVKVLSVCTLGHIVSYLQQQGGLEEQLAKVQEYRARYGAVEQ